MGNRCSIKTESCGFKCTGWNGILEKEIIIPKGTNAWIARMMIINQIPCDTCRGHAAKAESGFHDHINAGLGEKIYNESSYKKFVDEVNCVYAAHKGDVA